MPGAPPLTSMMPGAPSMMPDAPSMMPDAPAEAAEPEYVDELVQEQMEQQVW